MAKEISSLNTFLKEYKIMNRKLWFILLMVLMITISGCVDLSSFDLSGQVELERKDNGPLFREVYHNHNRLYSQSKLGLFDLLLSSDFIETSDIFPKLEFTKDFLVGQNNYTIIVKFKEIPPKNVNYLKIHNSQGEEIPITIVKEDIRGTKVRFDLNSKYPYNPDSDLLSGVSLESFTDSASKTECLLETKYLIECSGKYKNGTNNNATPGYIDLSIETNIGNRYFLQGFRNLNPKEMIKISVLDWNLDGVFNNEDMVQIDHDGRSDRFPLNKKFMVGSGKNQKEYIMNLKPEDADGIKYILNIDRTK
jgi:hypothetical protein